MVKEEDMGILDNLNLPKDMPEEMKEKLGAFLQQQSEGRVKFELKFNASYGIEHPFTVWIHYDQNTDRPMRMEFKEFESTEDLEVSLSCPHSCAQLTRKRYHIKNVPPEIEPFSLKLTVCPDCGAPMACQFIVYPGGVESFPKVRDTKKYMKKNWLGRRKKLPEPEVSNEQPLMVRTG